MFGVTCHSSLTLSEDQHNLEGRMKTAPAFGVLVSLADGEMGTRHSIIIGDARDMGETSDESVHLIVASPDIG